MTIWREKHIWGGKYAQLGACGNSQSMGVTNITTKENVFQEVLLECDGKAPKGLEFIGIVIFHDMI